MVVGIELCFESEELVLVHGELLVFVFDLKLFMLQLEIFEFHFLEGFN